MNVLSQKYPSKSVFITGAASGLGAAFAEIFAENNWTLHLSDINIENLNNFITSLNSPKEKIFAYQLDISNMEQYQKTIEKVLQTSNTIDILINNAGIAGCDFIDNYESSSWNRLIEVNLIGVFNGIRCVLPHMKKNNSGLIINMGSAAGFMNMPALSAYNASKAGVFSLAETLKYELIDTKIKTCVATPTFFQTNLLDKAEGEKNMLKFADYLMKKSTTNSKEVANYVLTQASKGKFHILFPFDSKRNFYIKRWFPNYIEKLYTKLIRKTKVKI